MGAVALMGLRKRDEMGGFLESIVELGADCGGEACECCGKRIILQDDIFFEREIQLTPRVKHSEYYCEDCEETYVDVILEDLSEGQKWVMRKDRNWVVTITRIDENPKFSSEPNIFFSQPSGGNLNGLSEFLRVYEKLED